MFATLLETFTTNMQTRNVYFGLHISLMLKGSLQNVFFVKNDSFLTTDEETSNFQVQRPLIVTGVAVSELVSLDKSASSQPRRRHLSAVPSIGTLKHGERYVVYRFSLYAGGLMKLKALSGSSSVTEITFCGWAPLFFIVLARLSSWL